MPKKSTRINEARLKHFIQEHLQPIIGVDQGYISRKSMQGDHLVIELGGRCCGCPGLEWTKTAVVTPALRQFAERDILVTIVHPDQAGVSFANKSS